MSCGACHDAASADGAALPCHEAGCPLPPLPTEGRRALALREALISLHGLVDPATVMAAHSAGPRDLALLAEVESAIRAHAAQRADASADKEAFGA